METHLRRAGSGNADLLPHPRIAAEFEHCMQQFHSLWSAMEANSSIWSTKIALMGEYRHALSEWGRSTGATGRSLDHGLRKNSRLRDQAQELLEELNAVLQSILEDVQMTAMPLLSPAMVEAPATSYFDILNNSNVGLQTFVVSEKDLQSKLEIISVTLDRLSRLATSLEHPFPRDLYLAGVLDTNEAKDVDLASKSFPKASQILKERIGRANWHRRCFLRHVSKMMENETTRFGPNILPTLGAGSSVKSPHPPTSYRPFTQPGHSLTDYRSVFSRTASVSETMSNNETIFSRAESVSDYTAGTSVFDAEEPVRPIRTTIPYPPIPLKKDAEFRCPYCAQSILVGNFPEDLEEEWDVSVSGFDRGRVLQFSADLNNHTARPEVMEIASTFDWSRHVFADLEPYVCTFDECPSSQPVFSTYQEWIQHEMRLHRTGKLWLCQSCDKTWSQQEVFEQHLQTTHSRPVEQLPIIAMLCEKDSQNQPIDTCCRLCTLDCTKLDALNIHTAQHFEQFALNVIEEGGVGDKTRGMAFSPGQTLPSQFARNLAWVESMIAERTPQLFQETSMDHSPTSTRPSQARHISTRQPEKDLASRNRPMMAQRGPSYTYQIRAREQNLATARSNQLDSNNVAGNKAIRTLPPQRNIDFVGRITDMAQIHSALRKPGSIHVLSGVGGMGKSALATEYTYRFDTAYSYIFWVQAETPMVCADTYSQIALTVLPDSSIQTEERLVTMTREFLETTTDRWLLVFDNVDQWLQLQRFLPLDMSKVTGNVLITTQLQGTQLADMGLKYTKLDLNVLSLEESRRLLLSSASLGHASADLKAHPEYKLAGDIAKMAARLPLALSLIAGFVLASNCSLSDFVELWRERQEDLRAMTQGKLSVASDAEQAMETAWNIGLSAVTTDARELLNILAFLDSETIQKSLLVGQHESSLLRFLHVSQPGRYRRITTELRKRRLISVEVQGQEEVLSIHRKLQLKVLQELGTEGHESLRERVFNQVFLLVRSRFPTASPVQIPEPAKWSECRKYLPHVLSLRRLALGSSIDIPPSIELARLFSDGGINLWERGLTSEGVELLKSAEMMLDTLQADEDLLRANLHVIISLLLQDAGMANIAECKRRAWEALQTRINYYKECIPSVYTRNDEILLYNAWADYGCILLQHNDFAQAEPIFERCLERYKTWGPPEQLPYEYAKYYHHSAFCRMYRGLFSEAISLAEQGCHWVEVATGAQSAAASRWKFDLACVVLQSGNLDRALDLHQEILAGRIRLHGKFGFPTLQSTYAVGAVYAAKGNLDEAELQFRKTLQMEAARPGTCSEAALARTQFHLSQILGQQKDETSTARESTIATSNLGQATVSAEPSEIEQLNRAATNFLKLQHPLGGLTDARQVSKEDELACFDYQQPVFDGRFTSLILLPYLTNGNSSQRSGQVPHQISNVTEELPLR